MSSLEGQVMDCSTHSVYLPNKDLLKDGMWECCQSCSLLAFPI